MKKAVIYCRVSSKRQVKQGHGLTSQEASCRRYAEEHGLEVVRVFTDDFTGGGDFWQRAGIKQLLEYLGKQKEEHAVIFDDLKRFARDTLFHLKLRQELSARNAYPSCPNFRFEDTPEGEFIETIIAATGQLERQQNRRQVISRMKARLEAGYWVFPAPIGYLFCSGHGGKMLMPDPASAEAVTAALEGFAFGGLRNQIEVLSFLQGKLDSSARRGPALSLKRVGGFLRNELYSGWCVCEKWGIRVRGTHMPLISPETHGRILDRLESKPKGFIRQDAREEFPLRGDIQCVSCNTPLTACWTQGRSQKYPYYRCLTKGCIGSIPIKRMEELFLERLHDAVPTPSVLRIFEATLCRYFANKGKLSKEKHELDQRELKQIESDVDALVESAIATQDPVVRQTYEKKIAALQQKKERLKGRLGETPYFSIEPALERGRELLANPVSYWRNGNLRKRKIVQERAFEHPIPYDRNSAYRTARFSLIYRIFEASRQDESRLVDLLSQNLNPVVEELNRWIEIFRGR